MPTSVEPQDPIIEAFGSEPKLYDHVLRCIACEGGTTSPTTCLNDGSGTTLLLFNIARYIIKIKKSNNTIPSEPAPKKRKFSPAPNQSCSGVVPNGAPYSSPAVNPTPVFVAQDISFTLPRKKLRLEVSALPEDGKGRHGGFVGIDPKNGEKEVQLLWENVDQVIMVPVPERATPAFHFVVIASPGGGGASLSGGGGVPSEPVVLTVPVAVPRGVEFMNGDGVNEGETLEALLWRLFDQELKAVGKRVVVPDAKEFVSGVVQAHKKGEKASHVSAYRGSKDGFLYFLPTGILFGFRKPILFFPFHTISSISYSSVLQRTFNLNISIAKSTSIISIEAAEIEEYEFAMLDQAVFPGIDAYVKIHGLNDASLGEARRAKYYNVNREKDTASGNGKEQGNGVEEHREKVPEDESELARAEREFQDREDEEEEDYEDSGGESDGSGSEEESEEGDGGGGEGAAGDVEDDRDEEMEEEDDET